MHRRAVPADSESAPPPFRGWQDKRKRLDAGSQLGRDHPIKDRRIGWVVVLPAARRRVGNVYLYCLERGSRDVVKDR